MSYLLGVNKAELVLLGMFSLKSSQLKPGAFTIPFRVLGQKKSVSVNVLIKKWYLLGVKKFQATPTKQDLGSGSFQNFQRAPSPFYMGVSPGMEGQ